MASRLTSFLGERVMVKNMFSGREILPHTQRFNNSSVYNREKMEGSFMGYFPALVSDLSLKYRHVIAWEPYCYDWCTYRLAYSSSEAYK